MAQTKIRKEQMLDVPFRVEDSDGNPSVYPVDTIVFSGATVTDLGGGNVRIAVTAGSGGGGLDETAANALYLRLDTTNDPLTDQLQIINANVGAGGIYAQTEGNAFTADFEQYNATDPIVACPVLYLYREAANSTTNTSPLIEIVENTNTGGTINSPIITYSFLTTERFRYDPNMVSAAGVCLTVDSNTLLNGSGKILSLKTQGSEMFYVTGSGLAYSSEGKLIADAPSDGNTYGRRNGAWAIASGGTGVSLSVTDADGSPLVSNVDKIVFSGATVTDLGSGDVSVYFPTGSGAGTPLTVTEYDNSPSVTSVDKIVFSGASVTDMGNGDALVTIDNPATMFYFNTALQGMTNPDTSAFYYGMGHYKPDSASTTTNASVGATEAVMNAYMLDALSGGIEAIARGMFRVYITAKQNSGTKTVQLYAKIYKSTQAGTETLLFTTGRTTDITTSYVSYELPVYSDSPIYLSATDRLIVKIYAIGSSSGTTASVSIQVGTTSLDRLELPAVLDVAKASSNSGWIPMTQLWTRTGNHTFTVEADWTTTFRKGTKVRYKDGGSFEYGVVASSSYASTTTTVTLITNTDYTMAAATITDTWVSFVANPDGFPGRFAFTSTLTASSGTFTTVNQNVAYYVPLGNNELRVTTVHTIASIGTASGVARASAPVNAVTYSAGAGRENAVTGVQLNTVLDAGSNLINIRKYDNGSAVVVNYQLAQTTMYTF